MNGIDSYPIFEPNQVLNHTHLNGLRDYLDEQSRLTRSQLIGIGIVCGLEVSLKSNKNITLSRGCGITSKGYLISLEDTDFTHYKPYKDPSGYQPFSDLSSEAQELLMKKESNAKALSSSGSLLNDRVVVLFLEYEDEKVDPCSILDCDEHGTWRDFQVRCLLITKKDALNLLKNTNPDLSDVVNPSDADAIINKKYLLDDLAIKRISYLAAQKGNPIEKSKDFDELALLYIEAVLDVLKPLMLAIKNAYETYSPFLKKSISSKDVEASMKRLDELGIFLKKAADGKDIPQLVQYYYDFVKDLINAYDEFAKTAFDLMAECCPDISAFPRHLYLGEAKPVVDCRPSVFRHHFKQPSIYNGNALRIGKVTRLYKRILLMIDSSWLLMGDSPLLIEDTRIKDEIKITPSMGYAGPLSQRAIPYYYRVPGTQGSLFEYWNDEMYRKCKADLNLSYHSSNYSKKEFITDPLGYTIDAFPFFRIEGHIGKEAKKAFQEIDSMRKASNLPFTLLMLFDGDTSLNSSSKSGAYNDLQAIYSIWRNKMLLFINNTIQLTYYLEKNLSMSSDKPLKDNLRMAADDLFSSFSLSVFSSAGKKIAEQPEYVAAKGGDTVKPDKTSEYYGIKRDAYFADIALNNTRAGRVFTTMERFEAAIGETAEYESREDRFIKDTLADLNQYLTGLIAALASDITDFELSRFYENYSKSLYVNINILKYLAESYTNETTEDDDTSIFMAFYWVHRILSSIALHPYIDIRILLDNLEQRTLRSSKTYNLFEFMEENIGLEHHGGVQRGGTFVLVCTDEGDKGEVIADFSLPYVASFKEEKESAVAKPILPLVLPVCSVVIPDEKVEGKESTYPEVNIQLLNNLYDPKRFEPSLTSNPKFGEAVFKDAVYEPNHDILKKVLYYKVKPDLIKKALELDKTRSVLIDQFKFRIQDVNEKSDVGESTITVFILTQAVTDSKETAIVSGTVTYGKKSPIQSANVSDENNHTTTTDTKGKYSLPVYLETNKITVSHPDFKPQTSSVDAKEAGKEYGLNFELQIGDVSRVKEEKYKEVNDALGISFGSAKADELVKSHEGRMKEYEQTIETMKEDKDLGPDAPVYSAAEAIERFVGDAKINILTLNNAYSNTRDRLFESIQKSSGKEKVLQIEAYKTLTMAYIDRLALEQPKEFSSTTKAALLKTKEQMNKETDLNMEDEISRWSTQVDDNLPDRFISNIRKEVFQT